MYVATIIGGLPNVLLPIIVLSRVGPKESAYWSIAISISYLFFQLPSAINQALLPELSYRTTERRYLIRRSAFLITVAVVPAFRGSVHCRPDCSSTFWPRLHCWKLGCAAVANIRRVHHNA